MSRFSRRFLEDCSIFTDIREVLPRQRNGLGYTLALRHEQEIEEKTLDEKSTATDNPANESTGSQPQQEKEKGRARSKRERPVKVQRRFEIDDLPRDEDGKVILPDDITYAEFIRLTHPEMTDAEVDKAVRKEERSAKLARLEILVFAILIIVVIILIVAS